MHGSVNFSQVSSEIKLSRISMFQKTAIKRAQMPTMGLKERRQTRLVGRGSPTMLVYRTSNTLR